MTLALVVSTRCRVHTTVGATTVSAPIARSYLEKCYNMTILGVEMNEPEDGVAPTDSRLRPDQRYMETTDWDTANKEKQRLEDKQRSARRLREREAELATAEG